MLRCFGEKQCEDDALCVCGSTLGGPGCFCQQCVGIWSCVSAHICAVPLSVVCTQPAGNRCSASLVGTGLRSCSSLSPLRQIQQDIFSPEFRLNLAVPG